MHDFYLSFFPLVFLCVSYFPNVLELFNFPEILAKLWNSFLATSQSFGLHVRKKMQVAKNDFRTLAKFSDKLNICKLSTKAGKKRNMIGKKRNAIRQSRKTNKKKWNNNQERQQDVKIFVHQFVPSCFGGQSNFSYFFLVYLIDFQWYLEQVNINLASMVNIYIYIYTVSFPD